MIRQVEKIIFLLTDMTLDEFKAVLEAGCKIVEGEQVLSKVVNNKPLLSTRIIVSPLGDRPLLRDCLKALFKDTNSMNIVPNNNDTLTFDVKKIPLSFIQDILQSGWMIADDSFNCQNNGGEPLFDARIYLPNFEKDTMISGLRGLLEIDI